MGHSIPARNQSRQRRLEEVRMLRVEILEGLHNDVGHRPGRAGIGEAAGKGDASERFCKSCKEHL